MWELAYTHTGIDYYSSFLVTKGVRRKTRKTWGVIFTCLTYRDVHLDIVNSLSMDAFLNAIEHFMAQYGDVTTAFYSDNGTNFCGADNTLRKMYTKNIHQKYQHYYRPRKISWYFNTPLASPQGVLGNALYTP